MYSQRNSEQALRGTTNLENQSSGLRNEFQTLKDKVESFEKDRKKWQDYESLTIANFRVLFGLQTELLKPEFYELIQKNSNSSFCLQ
jgi:predicted ribosome quality control (RQC) complex YloA/Tae2 family protein